MTQIGRHIGTGLHMREAWKVQSLDGTGAPEAYINPALPDRKIVRWNWRRWAIEINGMVVRGERGNMRLFQTAYAAAIAAEQQAKREAA